MKNKFFALALAAIGFAQPAMADNFVVSYDGFHDRLKVIEKGELNTLIIGTATGLNL